jgi:hypothetical protein
VGGWLLERQKETDYPKPVRLNCCQAGHPAKSKLVPTGRIITALTQYEQQGVRSVVNMRHSGVYKDILLLHMSGILVKYANDISALVRCYFKFCINMIVYLNALKPSAA